MEARPPLLIEAIVRRLTPPPCREHVLGDLCERYTSPLAYISQAVRTLPYVIVSQIRRTSDGVIVTLEAMMLWAAFRGAARLLQMPLSSDANGWVGLLIPLNRGRRRAGDDRRVRGSSASAAPGR